MRRDVSVELTEEQERTLKTLCAMSGRMPGDVLSARLSYFLDVAAKDEMVVRAMHPEWGWRE